MQPGTAMCFLNFYTLVFWTPLMPMHDNYEVHTWVWHNVAERTNLCLTSCDDRDEYRSRIFQCLEMKAKVFY